MRLPYDLLERIGAYCDLDTRRRLGLPPRRLRGLDQHAANRVPRIVNHCVHIPIADTQKTMIIEWHPWPHWTTYIVLKGWLPSASKHIVYYDRAGQAKVFTARDSCE